MNSRLIVCCLLICGLLFSIPNDHTMVSPVTSDPAHFVYSFKISDEESNQCGVEISDKYIIFAGVDLDWDFLSLYHHNGTKYNGTQTSSTVYAVAHNETHIAIATTDGFIEIYDMQLNLIHSFGEGSGTGPGQIDFPSGIDMNSTHILVTDMGNNRVTVFDHIGNYQSEFGLPMDQEPNDFGPWGISINNNNIYVVDYNNDKIHIFDTAGKFVSSFGGSGSGEGQFQEPVGIDLFDNVIVVADINEEKIQAFDLSGNFLTSFGHPDFDMLWDVTLNQTHILAVSPTPYGDDSLFIWETSFLSVTETRTTTETSVEVTTEISVDVSTVTTSDIQESTVTVPGTSTITSVVESTTLETEVITNFEDTTITKSEAPIHLFWVLLAIPVFLGMYQHRIKKKL